MQSPSNRRTAWTIAAVLLLGLVAGCGGDAGAYAPSETMARTALEAALAAWQDGRAPGPIAGTSPTVQAVDSQWQAGAKLAGAEIVGEEAGEGPRQFTVRLTLKPKGQAKQARYVVYGREPIW